MEKSVSKVDLACISTSFISKMLTTANNIPFHSQLANLCKTQQNFSKKKSSNLQMDSENLRLTFNLLTGYYNSLVLPSAR